MEVIKERLEREFDLDLIATAPTVIYQVEKKKQMDKILKFKILVKFLNQTI